MNVPTLSVCGNINLLYLAFSNCDFTISWKHGVGQTAQTENECESLVNANELVSRGITYNPSLNECNAVYGKSDLLNVVSHPTMRCTIFPGMKLRLWFTLLISINEILYY